LLFPLSQISLPLKFQFQTVKVRDTNFEKRTAKQFWKEKEEKDKKDSQENIRWERATQAKETAQQSNDEHRSEK
jgi:hypothetical protein